MIADFRPVRRRGARLYDPPITEDRLNHKLIETTPPKLQMARFARAFDSLHSRFGDLLNSRCEPAQDAA